MRENMKEKALDTTKEPVLKSYIKDDLITLSVAPKCCSFDNPSPTQPKGLYFDNLIDSELLP
jgi:hypothetical protein